MQEGKRSRESGSSDRLIITVSPSYYGGFNLMASLNSTLFPNVSPQCMNLGIKFLAQAFRVPTQTMAPVSTVAASRKDAFDSSHNKL